jgi:hypothetical protein
MLSPDLTTPANSAETEYIYISKGCIRMNEGRIVQIIGPAVDVEFPGGKLPDILNALEIERASDSTETSRLVVEVQQISARTVSARWPWIRPTASAAE